MCNIKREKNTLHWFHVCVICCISIYIHKLFSRTNFNQFDSDVQNHLLEINSKSYLIFYPIVHVRAEIFICTIFVFILLEMTRIDVRCDCHVDLLIFGVGYWDSTVVTCAVNSILEQSITDTDCNRNLLSSLNQYCYLLTNRHKHTLTQRNPIRIVDEDVLSHSQCYHRNKFYCLSIYDLTGIAVYCVPFFLLCVY